ncbi:probable inorganic phosphate transporter 1-9 [Ricinus communis]|uniref:Inorganic phosphate transporter, putative n=1 Tax=Ricinus communis TaxID=3988 RepID=B9R8S8_RICCO|nr:probable inorganic phosphate transporter 1-9 [Ricinus communis]EEF52908.1 inorganic phosphate transporter, putative [Ricinus communis]|eukprot:XP_002510721.1 probable inorganic phosphate transporter 1-9 [Ricinus communis]
MALKVLSALDSAKTQFYHFKAIIVAGMGLFTDAYDLFCFPAIMKLLGRIYYENNPPNTKYEIPTTVVTFMVGTALLGTAIGQVIFGRQGDRMGRRSVYGLALMLMVISSLGCGFSICRTRNCVLVSLGFFRFFLGLGIGGDYPLSATIMSEFANKRTRGSFIAGVFSMQGFGILASSAVTMVVCKIFWGEATNLTNDHTPQDADITWRLILMLGAIPAALTYYWRMMMPETARYTALVENNVLQAAKDMEKVLDVSINQIAEDGPLPQDRPTYPLLSKKFLRRHGRDLFSCSINWFLLDIVFYSSNLFQSQIYSQFLKLKDDNVYEEAFKVARFQAILAICSTIPGYYVTVYFIDRIGRRKIQIMGFLFMGIVYFALGIPYNHWRKNTNKAFLFLYALTFFFANFGPNTTTFMVPAELFPARFRSTCHGIAGAMGKLGALIGAIGVLYASEEQDEENYPKAKPMTTALVVLGVVCLIGMVVTYLLTPETMGRSLEENENDNEDEENELMGCFSRGARRRANSSEVTAL